MIVDFAAPRQARPPSRAACIRREGALLALEHLGVDSVSAIAAARTARTQERHDEERKEQVADAQHPLREQHQDQMRHLKRAVADRRWGI